MSYVLPFEGMTMVSRQGWRAVRKDTGAVVGPDFGATHPDLIDWKWHNGTDWIREGGNTEGTQLRAGTRSRVLFSDRRGGVTPFGGYGNALILEHAPRVLSLYAHCLDVFPEVGAVVDAGAVVATVDRTSHPGVFVAGPHLHWELVTSWPLRSTDTHARYDVLGSLESDGWFLDGHGHLARSGHPYRRPPAPVTSGGAGLIDLAILVAVAARLTR